MRSGRATPKTLRYVAAGSPLATDRVHGRRQQHLEQHARGDHVTIAQITVFGPKPAEPDDRPQREQCGTHSERQAKVSGLITGAKRYL